MRCEDISGAWERWTWFAVRQQPPLATSQPPAGARVVGGRIVTRAKFPEGTRLILYVDQPAPPVALTADDERAIDDALASVRQGEGVSLDRFRAILARM